MSIRYGYTTFTATSAQEVSQKIANFFLALGWEEIPIVSNGQPVVYTSAYLNSTTYVYSPVGGSDFGYQSGDPVFLKWTGNCAIHKNLNLHAIYKYCTSYPCTTYWLEVPIKVYPNWWWSKYFRENCGIPQVLPITSLHVPPRVFYSTGLMDSLPIYFCYFFEDEETLYLSSDLGRHFLQQRSVIKTIKTDPAVKPVWYIYGDPYFFVLIHKYKEYNSAGELVDRTWVYHSGIVSCLLYSRPYVLASVTADTYGNVGIYTPITLPVSDTSRFEIGQYYWLYRPIYGSKVFQVVVVNKTSNTVTFSLPDCYYHYTCPGSLFVPRGSVIVDKFPATFRFLTINDIIIPPPWYLPDGSACLYNIIKAGIHQPGFFPALDSDEYYLNFNTFLNDPNWLYHAPIPNMTYLLGSEILSGVIEDINDTNIIDTTKNLDQNSLFGKILVIETDREPTFRIVGNTSDTITVDLPLDQSFIGCRYYVYEKVYRSFDPPLACLEDIRFIEVD